MRFRFEHLVFIFFARYFRCHRRRIMRRRSCQLARTIVLTIVGAIFGFSVTMCFQTLRPLSFHERWNDCTKIIVTSDSKDGTPIGDDQSIQRSETLRRDIDIQRLNSSPPRNSFFVGIMTAQKYVDTRAYGIYNTWAQNLLANGSASFFVSPSTQFQRKDVHIPHVRLYGVDDTYPPQKKSFAMLKYFFDHLWYDYEWFIRVDDDAYLRLDKLEVFLRSLNSSQPLFIGQAGLGTPEEYGQLSLGVDENYCMGGPGIILSRETLRRIGPHIDECLQSMITTHEDVEVGRCIKRFAGVTCTWSYEMQSFFYNNQSGLAAYTGDLNVPEVHHSITLHPVKQLTTLNRLHDFIRGLKLSDLRFRSLQLSRDILLSVQELKNVGVMDNDEGLIKDHASPPSLTKFIPAGHDDLLKWEFLSPNIVFCSGAPNCPRHSVESYWKSSINSVVRQVMDIMNKYARQRGRILEYQNILYGYRRVDPLHGVDYVFDMLLLYKKFKGQRVTVPVRRHAYLQQSFGRLQLIEENVLRRYEQRIMDNIASVPSEVQKVLHIILPLSGRSSTFLRFVDMFERTCLKTGEQVKLYVVLFSTSTNGSSEDSILIRDTIRHLQDLYAQSHEIRLFELQGEFSRGSALSFGASQCSPDSLMFFTDVDVTFTRNFLYRVRLNTIRGRRVYFPIVFSQYAISKLKNFDNYMKIGSGSYHWENGYFRHFGYGLVSLYRDDFDTIGGFDLNIRGWGMEDVELFDKFIKRTNLTILRAPEPDLVHIYHPIFCDPQLTSGQYEMCRGSKAASFASVYSLANAFFDPAQFLAFYDGAKRNFSDLFEKLKVFM